MSKSHEHKIVRQVRDRVGKNWSLASKTIQKRLANLKAIGKFMAMRQGLNNITDMKTKHVDAYVRHLREELQLAPSTLQGYVTALRILARAIGKAHIVKSNSELGATRPNTDRYKNCETPSDMGMLSNIKAALYARNPWQGAAFEMQEHFGLRLKESIGKHRVEQIDGKQYLLVTAGFAKNSLERRIEIVTNEQLAILDKVNAIKAAQGSFGLIPANLSLKQGYDKQVNTIRSLGGTKANHANSHCLRREYVRDEYADIKKMSDKVVRNTAEEKLTKEIGHFDTGKIRHYSKK
ncbi:MAG: phage integrase N-terminal domain-containing protein [Desulfuromonadales bacterium]